MQANKGKGGKSKSELMAEAKRRMRQLSISELGSRQITQVSGGQLQRACICRSIMNEPEILFADEPTGALNKSAAEEVVAELLKLNREGILLYSFNITASAFMPSCFKSLPLCLYLLI